MTHSNVLFYFDDGFVLCDTLNLNIKLYNIKLKNFNLELGNFQLSYPSNT